MGEIPKWLRDLVGKNKAAFYTAPACKTQTSLENARLHTVCREARCPNRGECFAQGDATVMILGDICTRACKFCAVTKACRPKPPAADEPRRVAELTKQLGLKYLVLTMPTRDDLPDGGALHIHDVIAEVKKQNPACKVEPLISDLGGKFEGLDIILKSGCEALAHNIETVPSLYGAVRAGADYKRSLVLLEKAKKISPKTLTKSGLMLGMGEELPELKQTLKDLSSAGVSLLTLGQYLAPSAAYYPVKDYPRQPYYDMLKDYAFSLGFCGVMAGPLVRSSYRAGQLYSEAFK